MKACASVLVLSLCFAAGCAKSEASGLKGAKGRRKLEYPVEVAPLALRHVRYNVAAPGSIEAFQQVQITARVAGVVDKVAFKEGELIKAGQVLVTIESDRYQVAVDQAKAVLAKNQANEKEAEDQLARRQNATDGHPGLIPGEELASFQTSVTTGKADVEAATQALRVAELNLRDSFVRAPIGGIVQTRTVQLGQYVQPGAVLATLLQRDPLLLRFQVSEQDAPRIKSGMTASIALKESAHEYSATISLVAGTADATTRLVPVTATVDSTEHQYWLRPGAFCEVTVAVGNARDAIVVPTVAVQPTDKGDLAYVVEGTTARTRVVELGMHTPEGGVEVTRGLKAGEILIVRGIEPLSDGAPVKVTEKTTLEALATSSSPSAPGTPPAASAAAVHVDSADPAPPGSASHERRHRNAESAAP